MGSRLADQPRATLPLWITTDQASVVVHAVVPMIALEHGCSGLPRGRGHYILDRA